MASSSSSSACCSQEHNVFLSFRGEDTRRKFTSHLHSMLRQKSIRTYIDDRLEKGERISKALLEAIRGSKMSVVVLSPNYATSSWCLDEVLCIVECMRERGQVVVPVFYEVEPSNVRKQSGSYETAFSGLKERFNEDKVNQWKAALTDLANLSGFTSLKYGTESELVEAIVNDIVKKLNGMSASGRYKDLVGIEKSVEEMKNLLCIDAPDVRFIGIWGMGGLGKTTLARVLFDCLSYNFDASYFLKNVREKEEEKRGGIEELKKDLFSALLGEKDLQDITIFHKERLRRKKVLIVLDDVNKPEQLDVLAEDHSWFGDGSRVIVTTRDAQVLRDRTDGRYELKVLNDECALELFKRNAFRKNSPTSDDIDLSMQVVTYIKGIPLALEIFGSHLRSKKRKNWESELSRLKEVPNERVQSALRISYDGLEKQEQTVFLDIVCFVEISEGTCRHYAERILGGDGSLESVIDNLIEKSLISEDHIYLGMHDLIKEMGLEIVRQQSVNEPGKRSRLWVEDDCYHVLKNNTGTVSIEGISSVYRSEVPEVSHAAFKEMYWLRYLKIIEYENAKRNKKLESRWAIYNPKMVRIFGTTHAMFKGRLNTYNVEGNVRVQYTPPLVEYPCDLICDPERILNEIRSRHPNHQPEHLPFALKYLEWSEWPFKSMPSKFSPENLVELRMRDSKLETLWSGDKKLGKLKHVDLSRSAALTDVSALSQATNLESVNLSCCVNLRQVPSLRFGDLDKRYHKCGNVKCCTLGHLNLQYCLSLEGILTISGGMKKLDMSFCCPYKELPSEIIKNLSNLEELDLSCSKMLECFPISICELKYLKCLSLSRCNISEIPNEISCLSLLEELDLSGNPIRVIPLAVKQLCKLRELRIQYCTALIFLPELPLSLELLGACGCTALRTVWCTMGNVLQQEPWTDYQATRSWRFLFLSSALGEETCLRIFKDFRRRVLRTAAAITLNNIKVNKEIYWPNIQISFPGYEIPKWFAIPLEKIIEIPKYSISRIHLTIKLPPHWHVDFLGLAVAFVAEKEPFNPPHETYKISLILMANKKRSGTFFWYLGEASKTRGRNVFMWYNYNNYQDWRHAEEMMIAFSSENSGKVRAFGFRLLYLQDYEREFGKSEGFLNEIVFLP